MTDTQSPLDEARQVLQQHFGYSKFKPAQEHVIRAALEGEDVLAVLQTGYGKSVCFQVPAAMRDGCAIVISPLIALMKDQVDGANRRGIAASFVNSSLDPDEVADRLNAFAAGEFKLFYVAPERIGSNLFRAALARATVSFIVVDEAHCASMWGHDFRPSFARIHEIGSLLWNTTNTRPPIIAVTATATTDIEDDIASAVGMSEGYTRVVGDPVRPNLTYEIEGGASEWRSVMQIVHDRFGAEGRHLVYCSTQKGAEKVAEMICQDYGRGAAAVYHGGMLPGSRTIVQDAFVSGDVRVVCATNAFGMGIDVPDIRTVVHLGVPGSLEAYVQETGRAGRDGKPASVFLVRSPYSEDLQRQFIDNANPPIDHYEVLWSYLRRVCKGGVTLRQSANTIAEHVSNDSAAMSKCKTGQAPSGAGVSTMLNLMEGHGLIARAYYEGGVPVVVKTDPASRAKMRVHGAAATWLLSRVKDAGPVMCEVAVDKLEAPAEVGVSARKFLSELKALQNAGLIEVGKVFTGKATSVRDDSKEVLEVLPVEWLVKKRKRDLARFAAMLDYSRTQSNEERRKMIRTYFMGGPSA